MLSKRRPIRKELEALSRDRNPTQLGYVSLLGPKPKELQAHEDQENLCKVPEIRDLLEVQRPDLREVQTKFIDQAKEREWKMSDADPRFKPQNLGDVFRDKQGRKWTFKGHCERPTVQLEAEDGTQLFLSVEARKLKEFTKAHGPRI